MKVKIIRSYSEDNWYADMIGEEFYVFTMEDLIYYVIPVPIEFANDMKPLLILKEDCEVVDE